MPDTSLQPPANLRGAARDNWIAGREKHQRAADARAQLRAATRVALGCPEPGDRAMAAEFAGRPDLAQRYAAEQAEQRSQVVQNSSGHGPGYGDDPTHDLRFVSILGRVPAAEEQRVLAEIVAEYAARPQRPAARPSRRPQQMWATRDGFVWDSRAGGDLPPPPPQIHTSVPELGSEPVPPESEIQ